MLVAAPTQASHFAVGTYKLRHSFKGNYLAVCVRTGSNYGAFFPDLPGCVATGTSQEIVKDRLKEALEWHIASMLEDGDDIPEATTISFDKAPSAGSEIVSQDIVTVECSF